MTRLDDAARRGACAVLRDSNEPAQDQVPTETLFHLFPRGQGKGTAIQPGRREGTALIQPIPFPHATLAGDPNEVIDPIAFLEAQMNIKSPRAKRTAVLHPPAEIGLPVVSPAQRGLSHTCTHDGLPSGWAALVGRESHQKHCDDAWPR